ncbi:MAG: short-chain dehydrogenase/reductase [Gemmatimonadetes bacterium]|jgi:NAD(P)-dependent dehydrogenase (short-subunit alcohol dehydrogenase family)|nr:short-chain dehydrogenase/reductase [Gemmatimonadota bacterium]|tara:strand:- start:89162 stop:90013 length:852 start_codon:yes stop_codon:yes gene_type:complete
MGQEIDLSTSLTVDSRPVVLITGCSGGIGEATAMRFAREGYRVYASMRNPSDISESLSETLKEGGGHGVLELDVDDCVSVKSAIKQLCQETRRIDVLVNNAGISSISSVEEIDMDEAKAVFETNVFGALRVTQEVLPIMRGLRGGTLVNVSSVAGRLVTAGHGIYAASKHALEAISESLAIETSQFGVRVVLIEPGFISTTILNKADSIVIDDTVYGQHLERLVSMYKEAQLKADSPEVVSDCILKAVNDPAGKFRYVVGSGAQQTLNERKLLTDEEWINGKL